MKTPPEIIEKESLFKAPEWKAKILYAVKGQGFFEATTTLPLRVAYNNDEWYHKRNCHQYNTLSALERLTWVVSRQFPQVDNWTTEQPTYNKSSDVITLIQINPIRPKQQLKELSR